MIDEDRTDVANHRRTLPGAGVVKDAGASHAALLEGLQDLADRSLSHWEEASGSVAELVNLSENATYRIRSPGRPDYALRIHREGYNSINAIHSELAWMRALRVEAGVTTPEPIPDRGGRLVLTEASPWLPRPRRMVLFRWIDGREPEATEDLAEPFQELGRITARLHRHAIGWPLPAGFERLTWNVETVFGSRPHWGDWRLGPGVDDAARAHLERAEAMMIRRLEAFGTSRERYGLVHADLRLANLLLHEGNTRVIDFDDCGMMWRLYDLATALSFIEDHPQKAELIAAWLEGYERVRALDNADRLEIPTFILFRRMALLAWIGSHAETMLAQEQAPHFAAVTCALAEEYLARFG